MPIHIRLAQDEQHIEQALRLRHLVFREEEGLVASDGSEMIMDRFDVFPASKLFVALDEHNEVVGSIRITLDNSVGLPLDSYFDFRAHVPEDNLLMSISMFCVTKRYRNPTIASGMLLMCTYYALSNGVGYIGAPLNVPLSNLISRIGAKPLTEEPLTAPHLHVPYIPFLLDVGDLNDTFLNFVRQNMTHNLIQSYECMVFNKGEQIIKKGDIGDCAYVVVQGSAQVLHPVTSDPIAELSEGDVFGELALFAADNVRSADVVAQSVLRVMVLPKTAFLAHLKKSPESSLNLLRSMTTRMNSMLEL